MKRKKMISLLLVGAMAMSLAACSAGGKSGESASKENTKETGKILYSNVGPQEFFETPWLNPGLTMYNKVIYDRLIVSDENLTPKEGQLAESYEMTEDGKMLTFKLRDNIFWHDGEAITAEDIKWSLEYGLKTTVLNAVFSDTFKAIEGTEEYLAGSATEVSGIKIDGSTITINFKNLAPNALLAFSQFAPLPQKYFKDVNPVEFQQAKFFQNPIGSGAFKVDEIKMNNYTTLIPFDKYWNGIPSYSMYLTAGSTENDANFVANAKAGKLDYGYTKSIADVKALEGTEGLNIEQVDVRYTRLLYPNKYTKADGTPSPLANEKVRQAIRYAIDMDAVCKSVLEGAANPANSLSPEGPSKATGLEEYKYNPEKAKKLLKEANWDANTELDVVYYYTDQQTVDLMTIIQSYLQEVGVKMSFRLVEGDLPALLWKAPQDTTNGPSAVDWDMCYAAISALSMNEYYNRFSPTSQLNSHTPADETLTSLIDATNATVDVKEQEKAFQDLQKYENETLFDIPLYYQPVFIVTSDKIEKGQSAYGNPQFNYNWDIQNWKLK